MKTFLAIILLTALTACSDGTSQPETVTSSEVVQSATVTPTVTPEPVKTLFCTSEITTNCEPRYCPQGKDGCPTTNPQPCRPQDTSCKVLFCQPVGHCPVDVPKMPPLPILNVDCPGNPKHGCSPKKNPPVPQPILDTACRDSGIDCPPNSPPKKPEPIEENAGCWTECDNTTGM